MAERTTAAGICIHVPLELVTDESITPWAKLVYLTLASFADFKTAEAHPSIRAISKRCGVGVNVTQKAVNELASCGWIVRDSGRNSLPRVNRYRVNRERSPVQQSMLRQEEYCATENVAPGGILRQAQFECCARRNLNVAPGANEQLPENNYQRTTTNKKAREAPKQKPDDWAAACAAMTNGTLRTAAFKVAWEEWAAYRRDTRKKLTAASVRKQIKLLEGLGHDNAVRSIEQSVRNGWQGLFEPRANGAGQSGNGQRGSYERIQENIVIRPYRAPAV